MLTWKCGNHTMCNWLDDCPTGAQPPRPTLTTKWQAHLCPETPISDLQKRRPTTHLCRVTIVELIELAVQVCRASNTAKDTCIADMITIGFFFSCRPGEHMVTFDNKHFKLSNVQFYKDKKPVPIQSSKLLHTANFLTLTFDTQKNGVKGERIGHGYSTSATLCPILAVAHRVAHLNLHKAKPPQPLCSYYHSASSSYRYLASQDITQVLRASALHHPRFCVNPASVECRSLRTSGAMALFSRGVDALLIKLVGRWRSDAMLYYLHV